MSHGEKAQWQSRDAAIQEARNFVYANGFGTLSTVNQADFEFSAYPAGQVEYYCDSGDSDASLLMIRVDMSSAFRNIHLGSPSSFSIRTGDKPNCQTPIELAANHRIILYGEFTDCEPTFAEIQRFFAMHPDARAWRPGSIGFHQTFWTKFVVSGIYYIGGFGGEHYIGKLPVDKYKDAVPEIPEENNQQWAMMSWLLSWIGF